MSRLQWVIGAAQLGVEAHPYSMLFRSSEVLNSPSEIQVMVSPFLIRQKELQTLGLKVT